MRRLQLILLIVVLASISLGLIYVKVTQLGLPLFPGQLEPVWTIEAKVEFDGRGKAVVVDFDIPDRLGEFTLLDEFFVSRGYGLNLGASRRDRRAEWSTRRARGLQQLYYRIELAPQIAPGSDPEKPSRAPKPPAKPAYDEPLASAVEDVLAEVRSESADVFTFVSRLLVQLNNASADGNVETIRNNLDPNGEAWVNRLIHVLAGARIPARMVRGIVLTDGTSNQKLVPWLEVHNGTEWRGFEPTTGIRDFPDNFVRWSVGSDPLLEVKNGRDAIVSFATTKYAQTLTRVARDRAAASNLWLAETLLFNLPVNTQNVYRILLMVPIGALIVAFMRTIVGVPTLGTFMPILIAIAFRETQLLWGVTLFILITGAGLSLRFYLERLQLLLVPRLCAVLVLVVLLMLVISLLSARMGLDIGFSVALFPIVILTMVIEHMSVTWEESGAGAALKEGVGSLVVAGLGYLLMTNAFLSHLVFLFPESLLLLLIVFIFMGRYTGYRAAEILRFRDIVSRS